MKRIYLSICLLSLVVIKSYSLDSTLLKNLDSLNGIYECGVEKIHFDSKNKTFFLQRSLSKFQDVATPICYDTIAKGYYKLVDKQVITLFNDKNFHAVDFDLNQQKKFSEDTFYIKIILPKDDAFFPGRFRYLFNFGCAPRQIKSEKTFIEVPKIITTECESDFLKFSIQDLSPQWCIEEEKCLQRVNFKIFDLLPISKNSNYFTITLRNFDECYVEKIDVQNDFIYFDGNGNIYWHGKDFKKVED
jgi:hypothetical protein